VKLFIISIINISIYLSNISSRFGGDLIKWVTSPKSLLFDVRGRDTVDFLFHIFLTHLPMADGNVLDLYSTIYLPSSLLLL
jgi:hypothetical protein